MARVADHGIRYECASCGGRLLGLSPFEQLLAEGVGSKLWVSASLADSAADGGPCPFCSQPMHRPAPEAGGPPGLLVCHTCQQVLIPGGSDEWIAAHAAAGAVLPPPAAASHPDHCENCGAPREPDEQGRCPYCHAQLTEPQPVVINFDPVPSSSAGTGNRLLDGLVGFLTQPVD